MAKMSGHQDLVHRKYPYLEDAFINHFQIEEKLQRLGWGVFEFYALFKSAHIIANL